MRQGTQCRVACILGPPMFRGGVIEDSILCASDNKQKVDNCTVMQKSGVKPKTHNIHATVLTNAALLA